MNQKQQDKLNIAAKLIESGKISSLSSSEFYSLLFWLDEDEESKT